MNLALLSSLIVVVHDDDIRFTLTTFTLRSVCSMVHGKVLTVFNLATLSSFEPGKMSLLFSN